MTTRLTVGGTGIVDPNATGVNTPGAQISYEFDGSTMYATIPDWTPNGLPFTVEVSAVPLTVGATAQYLLQGTDFTTQNVMLSTGQLRSRYMLAAGGGFNLDDGFATQDNALKLKTTYTADDVTFDAVTSVSNSGTPSPTGTLITHVASNALAADPFHGPIYNLKLIDNSPIQDTTACFGNGTRYVELENPIVLGNLWEVEFDLIKPSVDNTRLMGADSNNRLFVSGVGRTNFGATFGGSVVTFLNALADVADGQHFHAKLSVTQNGANFDYTAEVDGVVTASGTTSSGLGWTISKLYTADSTPIPASSALQNVKITDLSV